MSKLIPPHLPPPQLYLTAARNGPMWAFLVDSGLVGPTGLMDLGGLPSRLREIVLLRTCVANQCDYEFNLHVQTISERMGLTAAEIDAIREPDGGAASWTSSEKAVIQLVDALVLRRDVTELEWREARQQHSEEALLEMTQLVGLYTGVAMMVALARPMFDLYRHSAPVLSTPVSTLPTGPCNDTP